MGWLPGTKVSDCVVAFAIAAFRGRPPLPSHCVGVAPARPPPIIAGPSGPRILTRPARRRARRRAPVARLAAELREPFHSARSPRRPSGIATWTVRNRSPPPAAEFGTLGPSPDDVPGCVRADLHSLGPSRVGTPAPRPAPLASAGCRGPRPGPGRVRSNPDAARRALLYRSPGGPPYLRRAAPRSSGPSVRGARGTSRTPPGAGRPPRPSHSGRASRSPDGPWHGAGPCRHDRAEHAPLTSWTSPPRRTGARRGAARLAPSIPRTVGRSEGLDRHLALRSETPRLVSGGDSATTSSPRWARLRGPRRRRPTASDAAAKNTSKMSRREQVGMIGCERVVLPSLLRSTTPVRRAHLLDCPRRPVRFRSDELPGARDRRSGCPPPTRPGRPEHLVQVLDSAMAGGLRRAHCWAPSAVARSRGAGHGAHRRDRREVAMRVGPTIPIEPRETSPRGRARPPRRVPLAVEGAPRSSRRGLATEACRSNVRTSDSRSIASRSGRTVSSRHVATSAARLPAPATSTCSSSALARGRAGPGPRAPAASLAGLDAGAVAAARCARRRASARTTRRCADAPRRGRRHRSRPGVR